VPDVAKLRAALSAQPRASLGHFPTPLERAHVLGKRLGIRLLVKRDDQTGLALGGNKVRKLEYLIGDALRLGCDCVITTGGSQSNHARLAAAACRKARMDCFLILDRGLHPEDQGNLLLDRLLGARVSIIESMDPAVAIYEMRRLGAALEEQGRKPYIIPRGGAIPAGAAGYAAFVAEIVEQIEEAGIDPTHLYLGTGSCGTHSGILAGVSAVNWSVSVHGISVSRTRHEQTEKILALSNATLRHLGLEATVTADHVFVDDRFVGEGYGYTTRETMEAIQIGAMDEGMILDPVYTGKALSGLIGHAREGRLGPGDTVIFLHSGGSPALFAYHSETTSSMASSAPI
jgi:D-cysteine desulfhydrase family pyridoxal phosphate-dependent enzyme